MKNIEINGSTREFVYQRIKSQIINCELTPGTKMSEKETSDKLEVSRTPVREAFLTLAQEELLRIIPQSGTIVTKIDLQLVEEGRFVREHIEKAIVREACSKINTDQLFQLESNIKMQEFSYEKGNFQQLFELDGQFHTILFEICKKNRTNNIIKQMNSHFDRLRVLSLATVSNWEKVIHQHKDIVQYVSENKPDLAEKTMEQHLKLVIIEKDELRERYPEYF
ncbi:GntR family transcriptional regulator [Evansella sp. AB-P1]|uniref:GntR family transcriptional regulator n=1 Tax=Evansella sp. AB-P1 TaxID=3037653 RepID=UPI00241CA48D|nr:GntR family transcriptional regulator [Evansella sp. AB-P1]MDG5787170.1 GntR family transcriptional regulator [Evansella sp. AB-P1]